MSKHVYLDAPSIGKIEKKYLSKAIDSGYISTVGPYVPEFEKLFAGYVKAKKAVSTQNGTAALHISLYELGIGKGDEVIVPALTFVASVNPVLYVGATPVFADADMRTWNLDPADIKRKITKRTKAIIPVHFYGNPCKMDEIVKIAKKYGLYVIEDATESLGATYRNKHTGTFGDLGCFSFNGNKIISTGGGGMVAGNNIKRLEHIKFLVNQARDESKGYYHSEVGFNYRMTNIEAALGLAQIGKLKVFLDKKKEFNRIYRRELKGIKIIDFQKEYDYSKSSYWLTCIVFKKDINIFSLQDSLSKKGVITRRIFMPLTEFPYYRRYKQEAYKNSYLIYKRGLCLPSSTLNSENDIHYACRTLKTFLT